MAWVETVAPSFSARHESADADAAAAVLAELERFRERVAALFPVLPERATAVLHPGWWHLALAHPWLPIARRLAAPAARRYFAGWFAHGEIHVLAPAALERLASKAPGSREALELAPLHEYMHLVVAANNPGVPPPFGVRGFGRYLRRAWLVEGAATWFAGQVPHLRVAVARRLREGGRPSFPPSARDAIVLGGTVYALLDVQAGPQGCVALATSPPGEDVRTAIERTFELPFDEVEAAWREHLAGYGGGAPRRRGRR
jgi:hypothetical protein